MFTSVHWASPLTVWSPLGRPASHFQSLCNEWFPPSIFYIKALESVLGRTGIQYAQCIYIYHVYNQHIEGDVSTKQKQVWTFKHSFSHLNFWGPACLLHTFHVWLCGILGFSVKKTVIVHINVTFPKCKTLLPICWVFEEALTWMWSGEQRPLLVYSSITWLCGPCDLWRLRRVLLKRIRGNKWSCCSQWGPTAAYRSPPQGSQKKLAHFLALTR